MHAISPNIITKAPVKRRRRRKDEFAGTDNMAIGTKAAFMKYRSVEQCLNCKKYRCNGCPTTEAGD